MNKNQKEQRELSLPNSYIDWRQVRINASISILNSLLETTKHSILLEAACKDTYADVAISYADSLIKKLQGTQTEFDKMIIDLNNKLNI